MNELEPMPKAIFSIPKTTTPEVVYATRLDGSPIIPWDTVEKLILHRVLQMQTECREGDRGGTLYVHINIQCPCQKEGEVKMEYEAGADYSKVSGFDLQRAWDEWKRRKGWQNSNQPRLLGPEDAPQEDLQQF